MTAEQRSLAYVTLGNLADTPPARVYAYRKGYFAARQYGRGKAVGFRAKGRKVYLEKYAYCRSNYLKCDLRVECESDVAADALDIMNR